MRIEERMNEEGRKTTYLYDELDRNIRTTDYDEKGKIWCDIHYEYNQSNQVSGWKVYKPENVLFLTFEVDYNSDGTEKETRQYKSSGELEMRSITVYDESRNEYVEKSYDASGEEIPFGEPE